jgi:lysophospholipase
MRRCLLIAGLLMLLAGCGAGGDRAAFTESRIPPSLGPLFWAPEGWAWGLIGVGEAPVQRYGVSSTPGTPRANILILTGYGETAEVWFETARDLNAAGYTVWVLERAGQGGSAHYGGPRDLIHAPSFDDDIAAVKTLSRTIVQGAPDRPVIIVGQGVGGLVALAAAQDGAPARAVILSQPDLAPTEARPLPGWLLKVGLGRLPAGWNSGWKRDAPGVRKGEVRARDAIQRAWQTANPDLRMGGPTLGWTNAFAATSAEVREGLGETGVETYVIGSTPDAGFKAALEACQGMPRCADMGIPPPPVVAPGEPLPFRDPEDTRLYLEGKGYRRLLLTVLACATGEPATAPVRACATF